MHEFKYRRNQLYCENLKVEDLVKRFNTPLYVYSLKTILEHYLKLKKAFQSINPLICFSVKANSNLAILKSLVSHGVGLDIVSGGELFRALKVGCTPGKIVYASVGKTAKEIKEAIRAGILFFNVESFPELEAINHTAEVLHKRVNVAIRINPGVSPATHKFITTGESTNKFGIDSKTAYDIFRYRKSFSHVDISGLHMHIGSQIIDSKYFIEALRKAIQFINKLKKEDIYLRYFNIGGGLGIIYNKERPQTAVDFARKVLPLLKRTGLKIILEPGRFIVGNAGILVTKVLYIKKAPRKRFIIVDAAMNDLMRPTLYNAYHKIIPLSSKQYLRGNTRYDVVGPICESADFFAQDRSMPKIQQGDILAIMGCGAYGFSMSSNYNSRLRPAEVMVIKNKTYLIRAREAYQDLIRKESIIRL